MAAFRDLLHFAVENEDYDLMHILLEEMPVPRGVTYDSTWPRFDIDAYNNDQCWNEFRFHRNDIPLLCGHLGLPPKLTLANGSICTAVEALCMVLKRFSWPNRLTEIERFFGRPKSTASMIINETVDYLYDQHRHRLQSLDNPWMQPAQLQRYADAVHDKGAPLTNCFGFIDGTVRPICRPTRHQRVCYNGHKRIHAIKFQSVVIPCGIIAHLYGPLEGRRHDCALLRMSGLLEELQRRGMRDRDGLPFTLYGDPAYPTRPFLLSPFRGAHLNNGQEEFNRRMSSVRECVEWEFGKILKKFAFLDFRKDLKVLLSPVAKYYMIGGLLANAHTCLYGSQTAMFYGLEPPTLEEYFAQRREDV